MVQESIGMDRYFSGTPPLKSLTIVSPLPRMPSSRKKTIMSWSNITGMLTKTCRIVSRAMPTNVDVTPPPVASAEMSAPMGSAFARPEIRLKEPISPVLMDDVDADADAASCASCAATITVTLTRVSARTTPVTMRTTRAAK